MVDCTCAFSIFDSLKSTISNILTPTQQFRIGARNFNVVREIGSGGFATVYLVADANNGRQFALKRILCLDESSKKLALLEVDMYNKFGGHPHILKMYDSAIIPSTRRPGAEEVLLLLEFYPRGTLQDLIERMKAEKWSLGEREALQIFLGICEAVMQFHKDGFAHRDLKPHNVLLDDRHRPALMDFGSVTVAKRDIKTHQDAMLLQEEAEAHTTPSYRAPELFDRGIEREMAVDERIDVWAAGCILYAILFHENPFDSAVERGGNLKLAVIAGKYNVPERTKYSKEVISLIAKMLNVDPTKRPMLDAVIHETEDLLEVLH